MEQLVFTTKGLVPFSQLNVKDVVELRDNARHLATEWYLEGELVRRDVAISMLRPVESSAQEGKLNGQ